MRVRNIIFTVVAFTAPIAAAAATDTFANRNVFTSTTAPCHLILCNISDVEGSGIQCPDTNQKYRTRQLNGACANLIEGQTWNVFQP